MYLAHPFLEKKVAEKKKTDLALKTVASCASLKTYKNPKHKCLPFFLISHLSSKFKIT